MPMSAKVRRFVRNDNDVADATLDDRLTTRADVFLARLIRLDGLYDLVCEVPEDVSHVRRGCRLR
jgi:hypothetical protein